MGDTIALFAAVVILIAIGIGIGIGIEHDSVKSDCDSMGRTRIGHVVYQCSPVGKSGE
jgi:hypothetical protein